MTDQNARASTACGLCGAANARGRGRLRCRLRSGHEGDHRCESGTIDAQWKRYEGETCAPATSEAGAGAESPGLLRCPLCGELAGFQDWRPDIALVGVYVRCTVCGCTGPKMRNDQGDARELAARAWNRRASSEAGADWFAEFERLLRLYGSACTASGLSGNAAVDVQYEQDKRHAVTAHVRAAASPASDYVESYHKLESDVRQFAAPGEPLSETFKRLHEYARFYADNSPTMGSPASEQADKDSLIEIAGEAWLAARMMPLDEFVAAYAGNILRNGQVPASEQEADKDVWLLFYEDAAVQDEIFAGAGAKQGAIARFNAQRGAWSCHLFRRVASSVDPFGAVHMPSEHGIADD